MVLSQRHPPGAPQLSLQAVPTALQALVQNPTVSLMSPCFLDPIFSYSPVLFFSFCKAHSAATSGERAHGRQFAFLETWFSENAFVPSLYTMSIYLA